MTKKATLATLWLEMMVILAFAGCAGEDETAHLGERTQAALGEGCEWLEDDCGNKIGMWCPGSPILLDMENDGFALTDVTHGVVFALHPQMPAQMAWTAPGSDDAFLALDRNGDGSINDGTELFGDITEQPQGSTEEPNGYAALSMFDDDANGKIDSDDGVWTELLLWTDTSHDGVSQPDELRRLSDTGGIRFLGLRHVRTPRVDGYGNAFRYVARVGRSAGSPVSPLSVDVFFLTDRPLGSVDLESIRHSNGAESSVSGLNSQASSSEVVAALDAIPPCDGEFPHAVDGVSLGIVDLQQSSSQLGFGLKLAATQALLGIIRVKLTVFADGYPANVYEPHTELYSYHFHGTFSRSFQVIGLSCNHKLDPGDLVQYTWEWVSVTPVPPVTGGSGRIVQRCIYSP